MEHGTRAQLACPVRGQTVQTVGGSACKQGAHALPDRAALEGLHPARQAQDWTGLHMLWGRRGRLLATGHWLGSQA